MIWTHLCFERFEMTDPRLERLLRIVADYRTAGVLIADPDLRWLYHPYDGGADVYPTDQSCRDAPDHAPPGLAARTRVLGY